jgi:enoyl-CoA hydratase
MSALSSYAVDGPVATITIDDGKVNALSKAMTEELMQHLEQAERDKAVVVLTGRGQVFSAGFDLRCEQDEWPQMMASGGELARRLLSFPRPVVIACNGNAIAMGALLLNAADIRLGIPGDFRIGLNEVALGMTLPWFAVALARHRLTRRYFDICTVTGTILGPEEARAAGFLDILVDPDTVLEAAVSRARDLAEIDMEAHLETKLRVREKVLSEIDDGLARLAGDGRPW